MSKLQATQEAVGALLNKIASHFNGEPRVTLIVRNPDGEMSPGAQDFVMSNDALDQAAAALKRRSAP